jgi:hypothetical protein
MTTDRGEISSQLKVPPQLTPLHCTYCAEKRSGIGVTLGLVIESFKRSGPLLNCNKFAIQQKFK